MGFWNKVKHWAMQALKIAPIVVTVASAVTAVTPNPTDDMVVAAVHKALDALALNVGYNEQDDEPNGNK